MTQISPNDVVPALRHHLVFSESPQGLGDGLLSVTNINNGEELRLRGFEYSLARMLDGHRTAREVVDAAEKLGLPLTLGGLEGFVNKLASFDLVGAQADDDDALSPFNPRVPWDEPTREMYRQALREGRSGHLEQATAALDELLLHSPEMVEAQRLRERMEQRQNSQVAAVSFPAVFEETERRWLSDAQDVSPAWIHGRGVMIFWLLIFVAAALTLGAAIVPLPRVVHAPAILLPIASSKVAAPRTGTISRVPVTLGQRVNKGDVLFAYDVKGTLVALDLAIVRVEQQKHALAGTSANELRTRYEKAESEVDQAEDLLTRARVAAGDPFSEGVRAQEDAFGEALEELHSAEVALDGTSAQQQWAALNRLQAEVTALERELDQSVVRAPQDGRVITLEVHPGDSVLQGADAIRLDDSRKIRVVATVDRVAASGIEAGQPVRLSGQGQTAQTTVKRVEGPYVEMVIDNPSLSLQPGIGRVEIRSRPRPFIQLR